MNLTFEKFRKLNRKRSEATNGFNHKLESWSLSDWFLATMGELGEAANVGKKLNRYRDNVKGNKETQAFIKKRLKLEIGDTAIYLDLLCQREGFKLEDCITESFNNKSKEIGYLGVL